MSLRLHRGAPVNISSSDLTGRQDASRMSTSQVCAPACRVGRCHRLLCLDWSVGSRRGRRVELMRCPGPRLLLAPVVERQLCGCRAHCAVWDRAGPLLLPSQAGLWLGISAHTAHTVPALCPPALGSRRHTASGSSLLGGHVGWVGRGLLGLPAPGDVVGEDPRLGVPVRLSSGVSCGVLRGSLCPRGLPLLRFCRASTSLSTTVFSLSTARALPCQGWSGVGTLPLLRPFHGMSQVALWFTVMPPRCIG